MYSRLQQLMGRQVSKPRAQKPSRLLPPGYRIVSSRLISPGHAYISDVLNDEVNVIQVELINLTSGDHVGHVDLVETVYKTWETHTYLDDVERGKGLGVAMYAQAFDQSLKQKRIIVSSPYTSSMARRVWESKTLNSLYEIEKIPAKPAIRLMHPDEFENDVQERRQIQYRLKSKRY